VSTPIYKGANQPASDSGAMGWLGQLTAFFSGGSTRTPGYKGAGQPPAGSGSIFGGSGSPSYSPAPSKTSSPTMGTSATTATDCEPCSLPVVMVPLDPETAATIDPEALARSRLVLLVPRQP
jgi:hypothetical protein